MTKMHGHRVGKRKSPTYSSWAEMVRRCRNPNFVAFNRYGGRGIMVCERWTAFGNFLADMGERPDGMTLDRIDSDGNYEPRNCRWATRTEQSRNMAKVVLTIEKAREAKTMRASGVRTSEIAKALGVNHRTIRNIFAGQTWRDA